MADDFDGLLSSTSYRKISERRDMVLLALCLLDILDIRMSLSVNR